MKILVGYTMTPEGRAALRHAADEARQNSATLIIANYEQVAPPVGDVSSRLRVAEERLVEVRDKIAGSDVEVDILTRIGVASVGSALVATAHEKNADLIVIGMRRRSPVGKLVLGSTAQEVLLNAPCPVLAVKRDNPP